MKKGMIFTVFALAGLMAASTVARADDDHNDQGRRLIVGVVNANGTSQFTTDKFTVTHPGTGHYVITFKPDIFGARFPICLVLAIGQPVTVQGEHVHVTPTSNCDIQLATGTAPLTPVDALFIFYAAAADGTFP